MRYDATKTLYNSVCFFLLFTGKGNKVCLLLFAGRVTTYKLTLNLTGVIDIGSLKTVVCPYDDKYCRFFLSRKKLPKSSLAETPKALISSPISLEVHRIVALLSQRKSLAANFLLTSLSDRFFQPKICIILSSISQLHYTSLRNVYALLQIMNLCDIMSQSRQASKSQTEELYWHSAVNMQWFWPSRCHY